MGRENFAGIGAWNLVSYESQVDDGRVNYPLGKDAVGQIMYDARGNMSAQIADARRPSFASENLRGSTPEEISAAYKGYVAYFGTYDIDESNGNVIHHVINSLLPNWAGINLVRYYEFAGNRMTLRTAPMGFGERKIVLTLVWERIA